MIPPGRALLVIAAISIAVAALFLLPRKTLVKVPESTSWPAASARDEAKTSNAAKAPAVAAGSGEAPSEIAAALNARGHDIHRDLEIASELFAAWQSNFPRTGNPVGENIEITAALTGENDLRFAFIPKNHPAINVRGELCDRWGTPFRFHQVSGTHMEIRSAGPDRKFATADDAQWPAE